MPKVLLINPPQRCYDASFGFSLNIPLSLLYLAAMIREKANVRILDCLTTDFEKIKYDGFFEYGTSKENLKKHIADFKPDIIGITVPFTSQAESAAAVSALIKEIDKNIIVIMGGPDVTVRYEYYLKNNFTDYCVVGEGEIPFKNFIQKYQSTADLKKIAGLAFFMNGQINYIAPEYNKNLDELPLPAYDMIDMEYYFKSRYLYTNRSFLNGRQISLITSRGCPFRCVFCSINLHMGYQFRAHSVEYIIKHIRILQDKYKIFSYHFEDDNISLDKARFVSLLTELINNKLRITWDTPNGIRADTLDYKVLKLIKKSGCRHLMIPVESGSQFVLDNIIKKKTDLKYILKIVEYCSKLHINTSASFVIGFPDETLEQIKESIDTALYIFKKYGSLSGLLFATPLYGTELYNDAVQRKLIPEYITSRDFSIGSQSFGTPIIESKNYSREELLKLIRYFQKTYRIISISHYLRHPVFALKRIYRDRSIIFSYFKNIIRILFSKKTA